MSVIKAQFYIDNINKELKEDDSHYKGLRIGALRGLHERASELVVQYATGKELLDLAAGTGAFSLRMLDADFNVTASEYVTKGFKVGDKIPLISCDLNSSFSEQFPQRYDVITAIESIEHIENARHFIRQCANLLKGKGILLITSPSIDSLNAKFSFLYGGAFPWFKAKNYKIDGHILPTTISQFEFMFKEAELKIIFYDSYGLYQTSFAKKIILNMLRILLQLRGKYSKGTNGQINIFVVQKAEGL